MYAVIELQGHQYIVQEGTELSVDKMSVDKKTVEVDTVLAVFDETGKEVKVGKPFIEKAKVTFSVVEEMKKDPKVKVLKFKRKNKYQRVYGFRAQKTVLNVKSIKLDG